MKFILEREGFTLWYKEEAKYDKWIITNSEGIKLLSRSNEREARACIKKLANDPNWR